VRGRARRGAAAAGAPAAPGACRAGAPRVAALVATLAAALASRGAQTPRRAGAARPARPARVRAVKWDPPLPAGRRQPLQQRPEPHGEEDVRHAQPAGPRMRGRRAAGAGRPWGGGRGRRGS
jgi:hypothetical protein